MVRCVKSCQEHDGDCALDPVHIITSTALSLPTLQDLDEPEGEISERKYFFVVNLWTNPHFYFFVLIEIILLRTSAEAKPDLLPDEPDVLFDLLATDELMSFDVIKRSQNGVIVGEETQNFSLYCHI